MLIMHMHSGQRRGEECLPEVKWIGLGPGELLTDVLIHPFQLTLGEFQGGVSNRGQQNNGVAQLGTAPVCLQNQEKLQCPASCVAGDEHTPCMPGHQPVKGDHANQQGGQDAGGASN